MENFVVKSIQFTEQAVTTRNWNLILKNYREPDTPRSIFELLITAGAFVLFWVLMWITLQISYFLTLLLALPTAGFLVRLFLIQHDCGHGAFFRKRKTNIWVGRVIGTVTLTPFDYWRRSHNIHHATSGNLEQRGIGDIQTFTVNEYLALTKWRRFCYRLYRHPLFMFGFAPAYLFLLQYRLPFGLMLEGWLPWLSTMITNLSIGAIVITMIWLIGIGPFLLVHVPIMLLAATIGVWLFYVQHQFEDTYWAEQETWSLPDAALSGSSHYVLPGVLRWFTANIGIHHVHHLCSRIPFYRLPQVLRDHPELADTGKLSIIESLRCVRLALWDEKCRRLISFNELSQQRDSHHE